MLLHGLYLHKKGLNYFLLDDIYINLILMHYQNKIFLYNHLIMAGTAIHLIKVCGTPYSLTIEIIR